MPTNEPIQRVRIYLNERDMSEGQPLYLATLDRLRREGATGATVLRGIAGFGAGSRVHTAGVAELTTASTKLNDVLPASLIAFAQRGMTGFSASMRGQTVAAAEITTAPIIIEWVDRAERVARVLPRLDDLLPAALITIEDLRVYRAVLRSSGIFVERTVGQTMARNVAAADTGMLVRAAAELMLERDQALLPVCDERGAVVGVLTSGDLLRRAELALPLRLLGALTADERRAVLDQLPPRTVADTMTSEPRTTYIEAAIPFALSPMVEWGLATLPVLDREGQLVGLFGVAQVLQAALRDHNEDDQSVRDADPPTPVGLVMQHAVPSIAAATPLPDALARLLSTPDRFLVVLENGLPIGTLSDLHLAQQLAEPLRSIWLAALRTPATALPPAFEISDLTAGSLADRAAPTIGVRATQESAIRIMLEGGFERLIVVDEDDGRLLGLLARRGLLRALTQVSAG